MKNAGMSSLQSSSKIITVVALILLQAAAMAQKDSMMTTMYKKAGPVYAVNVAGKPAMLAAFVAADGDKSMITLRLYGLADGKILKQADISCSHTITAENIIGNTGNVLWVLADSLVGYDIHTLEAVVTPTVIAEKHPFMQDNFSAYANNYLADEAAKVLYITAANDDRYKLYMPGLDIKPDDGPSDAPTDENFSYEFAAEYKVNDKYALRYALINVDTLNSQLYLLGSEQETAQVLSYFGSGIYAEREEQRRLTVIGYNSNGDKVDYGTNKPVTGDKKYFKAGFLQRKFFMRAWQGDNGEHVIVYEKDKKLSLAITDIKGKEIWAADTGQWFNNFTDYLIDDHYAVFWFVGKEDVFVSIDLQTGKVVQGK